MNAVAASLSGLVAAERRLETSARNVANVGTDGYRGARVVLEEGRGGGVAAREEPSTSAGPLVAEERGGTLTGLEKSNVDLVREIGELTLAGPLYRANLEVLKAGDEMVGALLDVVR